MRGRTVRRALVLCTTIVAAFQLPLRAANGVTQDVPVPAGIENMAQALGISPTPERSRFVAEVARLTHPVADGKNTTRAKAALALRDLKKSGSTPQSQIDSVPIPLTVDVWSRAVFKRNVPPDEIVAAIVSDPRAAHLCHGLAGLDDRTLQFFGDHPQLITWLYEHAAASFAAFAGSLHIQDNRVMAPGGAVAAPLWEAVVGEPIERAEPFVRELFSRDQGRLSSFYNVIAEQDAAHAAFSLGLWTKDPATRLRRFETLADLNKSLLAQWQPARLPFARPLDDIESILSRVQVEHDGSPSPPAGRSAWAWVFDGPALRFDATAPADGDSSDLVDAAWLVQAIGSPEPTVRGDRLDQLAFGQRAFSKADSGSRADVLLAIRGFATYRSLMLSLERSGVRHASVYATATRQAQQIGTLDERHRLLAVSQYQGMLALIERMAMTKTIDVSTTETLVASLSKLPLNDGRHGVAIAEWMNRDLRKAITDAPSTSGSGGHAAAQDLESTLLSALAGRKSARSSSAARIPWEGQVYRLDLAASEEQRLQRIRDRQGPPRVDLAVELAQVVGKLEGGSTTLADVSAAVEALRRIALDTAPSSPAGFNALRRSHEIIERSADELSKLRTKSDLQKAGRVAEGLKDLIDEVLADALLSWTYAVSIADADSPVLLVGNVAQRHDFGIGRSERGMRAHLEWAQPRQRISAGVPWHVSGSLLGLDLALSSQTLRRVNAERVVDAPTLSTNEREAFAASVALLNPYALQDGDRDVITEAIARGRQRVTLLAEEGGALDQIADEIRMDGWRRRALQWMLVREPERIGSMFSMTELLYLGGAPVNDLQSWGMAAHATLGCICSRLAPPGEWRTLLGRPQLGLMATVVPDLHLQVAILLRELQLPAAIARSVLTAAVQDFIDEARPTDANDWIGLVRATQTLSRERVEDYVAGATAYGPLVPDAPTDSVR
jgi:hypothetical protein